MTTRIDVVKNIMDEEWMKAEIARLEGLILQPISYEMYFTYMVRFCDSLNEDTWKAWVEMTRHPLTRKYLMEGFDGNDMAAYAALMGKYSDYLAEITVNSLRILGQLMS